MNAGFKRNVKYISLMQMKFLGWLLVFGCIYGLLMAFMNGGSVEELKRTGGQYFIMLLLIFPMSFQMRYVRNVAGFVLSMGCTRKNIIMGQHILSLEILAESILLFVITRILLGTGNVWNMAYFCYYAAGIIAMLAVGTFGGVAMSKGAAVGAVLYVVFLVIVMGGVIAAVFMASMLMGNVTDNGILNIEWNNPVVFLAMQLAALALYGIAAFFTAGKFRKMAVVC